MSALLDRAVCCARAVALLAVLALPSGCGGERDDHRDAGHRPAPAEAPDRPSAEQERALASALHQAHIQAEEKVACRECHRIEGRAKTGGAGRCLGCHEKNRSAVHVRVANDKARECLTCHDFLAKAPDPWECTSCHTASPAREVRAAEFGEAPLIEVHAREACRTCHRPHGPAAVVPGDCLECHEEQTTRHHADEVRGAAQCLECHGGHEHAEEAPGRCATCHTSQAATVVSGGHECGSCHIPHGSVAERSCTTCHGSVATSGAAQVPDHRKCTNCHSPHRARSSAVTSCTRCHSSLGVEHPPAPGGGRCTGCHSIHGGNGAAIGAAAPCGSCHEGATSPNAFHGGGATCTGCHRPHGFALTGAEAGPALCHRCHAAGASQATNATLVAPRVEHERCADCHRGGAHQPAAAPAACASCHAPEAGSMTRGHRACTSCHEPHVGAVRHACADCHTQGSQGMHRAVAATECATCHRPHGPSGPAQPRACVSCHDQPLPGLHRVAEHGTCRNCHKFHDSAPRGGRGGCLSACHSDKINHEPAAASCTGCHTFGAPE